MIASWMVWRRKVAVKGLAVRIRGPLVLVVGFGLVCGAVSSARAQCVGVIGECVNLRLEASASEVQVGDFFSVELFAKSANTFDQPIQAVEGVLDWDPALVKLLGNEHDCTAGSSDDPCYLCAQTEVSGPTGANWVTSGFPNDAAVDGLNADCGPDTFCPSYTGLPFNDGTASYLAMRQFFCGGLPTPAPVAPNNDPIRGSLLVTRFNFESLAAGSAQISLQPRAACQLKQKVCLRGDFRTLGDPCSVDSDCGERRCSTVEGPTGDFCSTNLECPSGICLPLCTACGAVQCCTAPDDNCEQCSFARSRVLSSAGGDITGDLGAPAVVSIIDCPVPTVLVDGSRYLNVIPPPGDDPVAIQVSGVSANVACVSKFVQSDGQLGVSRVYKTPAQWQSSMTDLRNDPTDPTVHVRGGELFGGETYSVRLDCNPSSPGTSVSDPVNGTLWRFGDVDHNDVIDITDILRILSGFSAVFHALTCVSDADCTALPPHAFCDSGACLLITFENVDIMGVTNCWADRDIGISDALAAIRAFQTVPDSCTVSCP